MSKDRNTILQNVGTAAALLISIIALMTSIYEANILKAQQKSMVWPYLSAGMSYTEAGFSIDVYNNGTGPAIVKSVEVLVDSKAVVSLPEMVNSLMPDSGIGYDILRQSKIHNYVFKSGEEVEIVGFSWNDKTRELAHLISAKVQIIVCYESVLGDSWIYNYKEDSHEEGQFKAAVEYKN
ncbi:MAG: hypothetical protein AAF990_00405 [Bacteroidota bacterium]